MDLINQWFGSRALDGKSVENHYLKVCVFVCVFPCICLLSLWCVPSVQPYSCQMSHLHAPPLLTIQGTLLKKGPYKIVKASHKGECWRKSLRGHDSWLTQGLDPDNWRLLIPFPVLGMYILSTLHMVGDIIKKATMNE